MTSRNSSLSGQDDLAVTARLQRLEKLEGVSLVNEDTDGTELALRDICSNSQIIFSTDDVTSFSFVYVQKISPWRYQIFAEKIKKPSPNQETSKEVLSLWRMMTQTY